MRLPFGLSKKKAAAFLALGTVFASVAFDGGLLFNKINPNQFGIKTSFGKVTSDILSPGYRFHVPLIQYTHDYNAQVQRIRFTAGGIYFLPFGKSTGDQNTLLSEIVLNYRVLSDKQKLGYHRWAMDGFLLPDGFWILTRRLNESVNAVMGKQRMAETLSNPEQFMLDLHSDLKLRLETNNIPVQIESIELNKFKTFLPVKSISYQKTGISVGSRNSSP